MFDLSRKFPKECFTTMKKSSMDTSRSKAMVNNDFTVLKLDDYNKKYYQSEIGASMCLKGADACFEYNDKIYIIEFKNRYLYDPVVYDVLEKMYASSIVVMDKLNLKIKDIRDKVCFIVVYTFLDDCKEKELYERNVQKKSITKIGMSIRAKGTKKIKDIDKTAFALKKLEKNIYKEVNAIPIKYFQRYLSEEGIINN